MRYGWVQVCLVFVVYKSILMVSLKRKQDPIVLERFARLILTLKFCKGQEMGLRWWRGCWKTEKKEEKRKEKEKFLGRMDKRRASKVVQEAPVDLKSNILLTKSLKNLEEKAISYDWWYQRCHCIELFVMTRLTIIDGIHMRIHNILKLETPDKYLSKYMDV